MIDREEYVEKIKKSMWDNNVKVITGIRRCGKSTLLFDLFGEYLLKNLKTDPSHIIKIKLDEDEYISLRNPILLSKFFKKAINNDSEKYYVFIDEVQLSRPKTDRTSGVKISIFDVLNGLNNKKNVDVYVTGSNSKMLSKDILSEFRGRTTQIRVHPFSFKEYFTYRGGNEDSCLNEYLLLGGMPELINKIDEEDKKQYLIGLFDETYIRDIVERKHIDREDVLGDILNYLSSQTSSLTNIKKIVDALCSKRNEKIDYEMVSNYITYLIDAFLISEAKRYDIKGKSYFDYPSKFYFEDVGLRNARLNFRQLDTGHLMENVIYNELVRRGYLVDVGAVPIRDKDNKEFLEIDFVVNKLDQKIYIQSALKIDEEDKMKSETRPLNSTDDNFKKVLIRNDIVSSFYDEKGIYNCRLVDFLLGRVEIM